MFRYGGCELHDTRNTSFTVTGYTCSRAARNTACSYSGSCCPSNIATLWAARLWLFTRHAYIAFNYPYNVGRSVVWQVVWVRDWCDYWSYRNAAFFYSPVRLLWKIFLASRKLNCAFCSIGFCAWHPFCLLVSILCWQKLWWSRQTEAPYNPLNCAYSKFNCGSYFLFGVPFSMHYPNARRACPWYAHPACYLYHRCKKRTWANASSCAYYRAAFCVHSAPSLWAGRWD